MTDSKYNTSLSVTKRARSILIADWAQKYNVTNFLPNQKGEFQWALKKCTQRLSRFPYNFRKPTPDLRPIPTICP